MATLRLQEGGLSGSGPTDTLTLTGAGANAGQTAMFTDVTLANGASKTFQPVTTEVIGGVTYYVATLDPPGGSTGTGSTRRQRPAPAPTARRAVSAPPVTPVRPRLAAIAPAQADGGDQPRQLVRPAGSGPRFRYIAGPAAGQPGDVAGEDGTDLLIRAGTHFVRNFSLT
jgi:hypothetical protein